jgi:hypothetical protein
MHNTHTRRAIGSTKEQRAFVSQRTFVCLFTLVVLLVTAGGARAAVTHKYLSQITAVPVEGPHKEAVPSHGQLEELTGMTVEAGSLWVDEKKFETVGFEGAFGQVDRFDVATGSFEAQLPMVTSLHYLEGAAVRNETLGLHETELYVSAQNEETKPVVAVFGASGSLQATWNGADTPTKSFGCKEGVSFCPHIADVAVDDSESPTDWASGDVYVAVDSDSEPEDNVVDVFKPESGGGEEYVGQLPGPHAGFFGLGQHSVTIDEANGDVVVANGLGASESAVYVFEPTTPGHYALVRELTGTPQGVFNTRGGISVAVDGGAGEATGDIYVADFAENVVYEFDAAGKYLGELAGTPSGRFEEVYGVAVDAATHDLYVGAKEAESTVIDVFGPNLVISDVTSGSATEVSATTALLHGAVNPGEAGEVVCEFEYGTSSSYGRSVPCEPKSVANGTAVVGVSSRFLEGLSPDTTYHYRLVAANENGPSRGEDQTFTTKGPGIIEASSTEVTSTSATLNATISPGGVQTSSFFQYGATSEYGQDAPAPGLTVGSGDGPLAVSPLHIHGLTAGTLYHYRVVAVSEVEVTLGHVEVHQFDGPDQTFMTQTAGEVVLPDGRQWELVSPPDKHGANIEAIDKAPDNGDVIQSALDGGAVTYVADAPTESAPAGYSNLVQVFSARGPDGWVSHDLALPHAGASRASVGGGSEYRFFSEDLSSAFVQPFGHFEPALSAEASEQTAFLHTDFLNGDPNEPCEDSCYRPLVTGESSYANVPEHTVFGEYGELDSKGGEEGLRCPPSLICGPVFVGATADDSHVVLGSPVQLTRTPTNKAEEAGELYEWDQAKPASEQLQLVSVLPEKEGGSAPTEGAKLGTYSGLDARNAISADGSHVFFTPADGDAGLYLRDVIAKRTLRLDLPEAGCETCGKGVATPSFQLASSDGSRVFFSDAKKLTSDATQQESLYECVISQVAEGFKCELLDLTPKGAPGEDTAMQGRVLGSSEDGSWVYFVANGVLENAGVPVRGAVHGNCKNGSFTPGAECNLYVRHDGVTGLVAVLSGEDGPGWSDAGESLINVDARVSPDGEWLAFMSDRDLTGYDTRDALSGRLDEEVYLYDAKTRRLVCASCDPSGARPVGEELGDEGHNMPVAGDDQGWATSSWFAANVPGWTEYSLGKALYQSRYLSNSGRLFFNSRDPLVSQAVNGTWDVYEYEPEGVGGEASRCGSSTQSGSEVFKVASSFEVEGVRGEEGAGCVALVSSGESPDESAFLDASETGGEVFFLTAAKLVSQDYDDSYDVYDAHECTSASPCFPVSSTTPPACTTADACRAAPTPQPAIFGAPSSATFNGQGNVAPPSLAPVVKPKTLTRAQRLARALKACRKDRGRARRVVCERQARKQYGSAMKTKRSSRAGSIRDSKSNETRGNR